MPASGQKPKSDRVNPESAVPPTADVPYPLITRTAEPAPAAHARRGGSVGFLVAPDPFRGGKLLDNVKGLPAVASSLMLAHIIPKDSKDEAAPTTR
jgi:hypothetical protein